LRDVQRPLFPPSHLVLGVRVGVGARRRGNVRVMSDRDVSRYDAEVVIVGGGPVGMGLAIELGQRGVRAILVERYPEPQPIPKGQNLTQRTMEHFHFWGAEAALRAARTIPPSYGIGGLTAYGTLLGPYAYD
jgi:4-hydroxyisophthalate hydroxylase